MSAFMVSREHIDALVLTAINGPRGGEGRWDFDWAAHDPRETRWRDQEWRSISCGGRPELRKPGEVSGAQVGEMLWRENERSLEARYPADHAEMLSVDYCLGYDFGERIVARPALTIAEAFKAIACLEYQSCEHGDWEDSESFRFLQSMRCALSSSLPGYSEAAWEVREQSVA